MRSEPNDGLDAPGEPWREGACCALPKVQWVGEGKRKLGLERVYNPDPTRMTEALLLVLGWRADVSGARGPGR
jgi:hypothetical protein